MTRLIAALLLILSAFALASAQQPDPPEPPVRLPIGGGRSYLPFDVVDQDGKKAWKVVGRGNVKVEDLVGGLSTALGKRISFTTATVGNTRYTVSYTAPEGGIVIANAELLDFSNELLAAAGVTVVGLSGSKGTLVTHSEAGGYSVLATAAELEGMPATEWVTVTHATTHIGSQALRDVLTRNVSVMHDYSRHVITGPAEQVRKALRLLRELDQPRTDQQADAIRTYTLPAGVQSAAAANALAMLFEVNTTEIKDMEGKYRVIDRTRARVTVAAHGASKLIVRASVQDHALVAAALDAMK